MESVELFHGSAPEDLGAMRRRCDKAPLEERLISSEWLARPGPDPGECLKYLGKHIDLVRLRGVGHLFFTYLANPSPAEDKVCKNQLIFLGRVEEADAEARFSLVVEIG